MKKITWVILLFVCSSTVVVAQWQEAVQLSLNIQKLNQLRQILQNMYNGYRILTEGYSKVKNITEGNYKLHEVFLDGLKAVNPNIRNYQKVFEIIKYQRLIVKDSKDALRRFLESKAFTPEEIELVKQVFANLVNESLQNAEALGLIISSNKLRMNDSERLIAIENLHRQILQQFSFLQSFNYETSILGIQRAKESNDIRTVQLLYGVVD